MKWFYRSAEVQWKTVPRMSSLRLQPLLEEIRLHPFDSVESDLRGEGIGLIAFQPRSTKYLHPHTGNDTDRVWLKYKINISSKYAGCYFHGDFTEIVLYGCKYFL